MAACPAGGDLPGNARLRSVVDTARAMVTEAGTDNKNHTVADPRFIFSKNGGSLAPSGSVLYVFHKKGPITVPRSLTNEERTLELTLGVSAAAQVLPSYETLEDNDDTQNVYSHFDIPEEVLARLPA